MRLIIGLVLGVLSSGCMSSPLSAAPVKRIAQETISASISLGREAVARGCSKVTHAAPFDLSLEGVGARLRDQTSLDEVVRARAHEVTAQVRHLSFKWRKAKPALTRAMVATAKFELKALCAKVAPTEVCSA